MIAARYRQVEPLTRSRHRLVHSAAGGPRGHLWWLLPVGVAAAAGYAHWRLRNSFRLASWDAHVTAQHATEPPNGPGGRSIYGNPAEGRGKAENRNLREDLGGWMPEERGAVFYGRRIATFTAGLLGLGLALVLTRYRRCPSNMVLVVYGRALGTATGGSISKTLHGGGTIVWPILQDYRYLNLQPMQLDISLKESLSLENIRVNVPSVFTVAVGTEDDVMQNAAIRLLSQDGADIKHGAEEIILGQLRQVVASMEIQEITRNREKFAQEIERQVGIELRKIGLILINVNIRDITDDSGFIEALGQKAASQVINQAKVDVSERDKLGAIGVAKAEQEKKIQVAEAEKDQAIGMKLAERDSTVQVAALRAQAITGENEAEMKIAESNASLQIKKAEYFQLAETKERQANAAVLEADHLAQAKAALALKEKVEAEKRAELEAPALAMKRQIIVEAEAEQERMRITAHGEADAILLKQQATAKGQFALLQAKGEGLGEILEKCNKDPNTAFRLLMLDHLDHLSEQTAKAISNIKFDKVVVWDGGSGSGKNATADFVRGVARSVPPSLEILKDIGGVDLPQYFGSLHDSKTEPSTEAKQLSEESLNH